MSRRDIRDDRGQVVDVVLLDGLPKTDSRLREMVRLRQSSNWGALAAFFLVWFVVQVAMAALIAWSRGTSPRIMLLAWSAGVGAVVTALLSRAHARRRSAGLRAGLLYHRLCVQCGYPLAGVAAAADGCTVCPECGAAWKLARKNLMERLRAGALDADR